MTNFKRTMKKAAAVTLALAMVLAFAPSADAKSKVKKPTINKKTASIKVGKKVTLKVKKGTYKIKSVKWTSSDKSVAKVKKSKKATSAVVTGKKVGNATIKAVVTTKKSAKKTKKYTLKTTIKVKAAPEPVEPAWVTETNPVVPEYLKEKIAANPITGVNINPLAVLATQEVAGTNYRLLVEETSVTQTPESFYAIEEVYTGNDGEIYKINHVASTQHIFDAISADSTNLQPQYDVDMEIPATVSPLIDQYRDANEIPYNPIAIVAKEPGIAILGDYLVICETEVEDGHTGYVMLTLTLSGNLPTPDISFGYDVIPFSFNPSTGVYKDATENVQPYEFDQAAANIRFSLLSGDYRGIAAYVDYNAIEDVDGQDINNEQELISYFNSFVMDEKTEKAIFNEPCTGMFANGNGVMFAGGLIWLNEVDGEVAVTTINIKPVGTWVTESDPTVDEEMLFYFERVNAEVDEVTYEPVAVLSHKHSVEGDKDYYRVLTERKEIGDNSIAKYAVLEFAVLPNDDVNPVKPYFSDPLTDVYPAVAEDGGFAECEDVSLSADEKADFKEAIENAMNPIVGSSIEVIAKVAQQVVEGTNYRVMVEQRPVAPDEEPSYFMITVNADLAGKVTSVDTASRVNFSEVVPE